jgi:hypothetical protein
MNSKIIAAQNDRVESLQYSNVLIAFLFIMKRQCCPRIESRWRAPHLLLLLELPVQSNKDTVTNNFPEFGLFRTTR